MNERSATDNQEHEEPRPSDPVAAFLADIRHHIESLIPADSLARVLQEVQEAAKRRLGDFELVPRREFDAHLAALTSLNQRVRDLEQRISTLEDGC